MDVLKLRFCSHHITELIWMCRKRPTLAIGHYSWPCHHYYYLLVSMVWSIHFGRRNSLNAYLIAQFVLLSNSKPPWTTQRSGILKTDTHIRRRQFEQLKWLKTPWKIQEPTNKRNCDNGSVVSEHCYNNSHNNKESVSHSVSEGRTEAHDDGKNGQPAAASVAYVHQPPPATVILRPSASWLVFT